MLFGAFNSIPPYCVRGGEKKNIWGVEGAKGPPPRPFLLFRRRVSAGSERSKLLGRGRGRCIPSFKSPGKLFAKPYRLSANDMRPCLRSHPGEVPPGRAMERTAFGHGFSRECRLAPIRGADYTAGRWPHHGTSQTRLCGYCLVLLLRVGVIGFLAAPNQRPQRCGSATRTAGR